MPGPWSCNATFQCAALLYLTSCGSTTETGYSISRLLTLTESVHNFCHPTSSFSTWSTLGKIKIRTSHTHITHRHLGNFALKYFLLIAANHENQMHEMFCCKHFFVCLFFAVCLLHKNILTTNIFQITVHTYTKKPVYSGHPWAPNILPY